MTEDPSESRMHDADEIDYFLGLEEARTKSMSVRSSSSLALLWDSLRGQCITASSLVIFYYASLPLKRVSYLLTTKQELENDGRWSKGGQGEGTIAGAPLPVCAIREAFFGIYHNEGAWGFFRGACLSAALAVFASIEGLAVMALLRCLTRTVPTPSSYDSSFPLPKKGGLVGVLDSETFAAFFWWVLVPAVAWAVRWPSRSFRTILLTTYMAGHVVDVKEETISNWVAPRREESDGKNATSPEPIPPLRQQRFVYPTYVQLWKRIQTECGWWDILSNGWEVDLLDHVMGIALGKMTQACVGLALAAEKFSPQMAPWLLLSPKTICTLLRVSLSCVLSVVVLTVRQPFLVVSRRMALLSSPSRTPEERHVQKGGITSTAEVDIPVKEKGCQSRRVSGLRYCNAWSCVSYILHHEGWRNLFSGLSFNLMVQMVLLGSTLVQQRLSMY